MKYLKFAVVILNAALLAMFGWLMIDKGLPKADEAWLAFLVLATPLATLTFIWLDGAIARDAKGLISLELEARKAKLRNEIKRLGSGE